MKYKVGDEVKYIGGDYLSAKKGATGKIYKVDSDYIYIKWVRNELANGQHDGGYCQMYFELVKPKQFTKSDLKDNHIVVLRNNTKILYTKDKYEDGFKKLIKHDLTHSYGAHLDIMEVWEFETLIWKREESILDDKEKEWLNHFIKSTNIKVKYIVKYESDFYNNREYLEIDYNNSDDNRETIRFPYFEKGSMYQGMELDKEYTLEELGLE